MAIIKKLTESDLLIGAEEGTTLTAENWNSVMSAILNAINTNASAVNSTIAAPVAVTIYPYNSGASNAWSLDNSTKEYYCSFDKEVLNKPDKVQAHFYNVYGTEVSCNYIQDGERVTVYSRVDAEILAIFR